MDPLNVDRGANFLVIGDTPVARRVCATMRRTAGQCAEVLHMVTPGDADLQRALKGNVVAAAILIRDDVSALRYALAVAHLDETLPLTVTVFDRTIAEQLRVFLPQASVVSPASLSVPSLVGACLGTDASQRLAPSRVGSSLARLRVQGHHHDRGTRLLLGGLLGLAAVLVLDWTWLVLVERHDPLESFLDAARVVATVGPGPSDVSALYGVVAATAMLVTIVLTALFTAGLVDRLLRPPFLGLIGRRTVPRRRHVIVVGMGQVGIRLSAELMSQGVPVIGVERDSDAELLPLARALGIPIVIGQGADRRVLERLGLSRSRALAAVASDDLDNVAVAVAASAVSPQTRVVLRAGEHEAISETRSLLPLGVTRDVTEIAAHYVVARLEGQQRAKARSRPGTWV